MTKNLFGLFVLFSLSVFAASCTKPETTNTPEQKPSDRPVAAAAGLTDADLQAIRNLGSAYNPALRTEDLSKSVNEIYADDALLIPPDSKPLRGRQQILEHLRALGATNWDHRSLTTVGRGDVAYELSRWTVSGTDQNKAAFKQSGICVDILRKMPDGRWMVATEMYSVIPEGQMADIEALVGGSSMTR